MTPVFGGGGGGVFVAVVPVVVVVPAFGGGGGGVLVVPAFEGGGGGTFEPVVVVVVLEAGFGGGVWPFGGLFAASFAGSFAGLLAASFAGSLDFSSFLSPAFLSPAFLSPGLVSAGFVSTGFGASVAFFLTTFPVSNTVFYGKIYVTTPAATVFPPSLKANLAPFTIVNGKFNLALIFKLSPGFAILTPSGRHISAAVSAVL